jgi:hypothetical protein
MILTKHFSFPSGNSTVNAVAQLYDDGTVGNVDIEAVWFMGQDMLADYQHLLSHHESELRELIAPLVEMMLVRYKREAMKRIHDIQQCAVTHLDDHLN